MGDDQEMSDSNDFTIDGTTYRPVFDELGEIGGCYELGSDDVLECKDCIYEGKCPGQFDMEDEE